jgi:FkbM family methyltransferase
MLRARLSGDRLLSFHTGRLAQYIGNGIVLARVWPRNYIYLDAADTSLTPSILRRGAWERRIMLIIMLSLKRGGTMIDIGANCGYHALAAMRRVGKRSGTVIAFEPQSALCTLIQRSIEANDFLPGMKVMRLAIGAREETGSLGKMAHLKGSASFCFGEDVPDREHVPVVPLPVALEAAAKALGRPVIPDVIKIDVEGFEMDVWEGMREWTRMRERLTIVIEFSPFSYRNAGRDPLAFLHELRAFGFSLHALERLWLRRLDDAACARIAAGDRQVDLVLRKLPRR